MRLDIIDVVAYLFDITRDDILSSCRKQKYCDARVILSRYYRNLGYTLVDIGKIFNRDHSTIVRQLKLYDSLYKNYKYFRVIADKIMNLDILYIEKCLSYGEKVEVETKECESSESGE